MKNFIILFTLLLCSCGSKKVLLVVESPYNCIRYYYYDNKSKIDLEVFVDVSSELNNKNMVLMTRKTYLLKKDDIIFLNKKLKEISIEKSHVDLFANDAFQFKLYVNQELKYNTFKSYKNLEDIKRIIIGYEPIYNNCGDYE